MVIFGIIPLIWFFDIYVDSEIFYAMENMERLQNAPMSRWVNVNLWNNLIQI